MCIYLFIFAMQYMASIEINLKFCWNLYSIAKSQKWIPHSLNIVFKIIAVEKFLLFKISVNNLEL